MAFHSSRTTSGSLIPFRFGSPSDSPQRSGWTDGKDNIDSFTNSRARRASTQSGYKGKEPAHDVFNGRASPATAPFPFVSNAPFPSSRSKLSHDSARPSTADAMPTRKPRGSIFVAASDALGLKFGRKKPAIIRQPPPMPFIHPDVIEISAARRDEEDEERDRLREAAAHSIGLQVIPTPETHSLDESVEETHEGKEVQEQDPTITADNEKQVDILNAVPMSPKSSIHSVASPSPVPFNRFRSKSLLVHSRPNSMPLSPIPPFPSTFTVIDQYQQSGTMLDKYYQPSSLRIFALSKNWRRRFMVLSSPNSPVTRNSGPFVSYLHLFKSSAGEDKEIERLEINEDSVVFISEDEVGGRKHVVKVGGVDVGAMKKELNCEENGRTMWFLHVTDSTEAQKWITAIKTAIFGQRTVRAGLGLPTLGGVGVEPRGDMDVMLSMRAQGLITSPATTKPKASQYGSSQNGYATSERNYASSVSSRHSQATVSRAGSTNAVSALRGLFSGSTRPRSGSRATSIDSQHERDRDTQEDSFGSVGHHLLGRPSTADTSLRPHSVMTHASLPISGPGLLPEHRLDRKIVMDRPIQWVSSISTSSVSPVKTDRANRSLSLGALSLQPPPRKRWTSAGPVRPGESVDTDVTLPGQAEVKPHFGGTVAPVFTFGTPEHRPKAPSIQSVSTLASAENSAALDKMSSSPKRSSRRWSRQGMLPRRPSPPSGPPPSIPTNQGSILRVGRASVEISSPRSETGSTHSVTTQKSFVSSLPSFSKRASGSSVLSASSSLQSPAASRSTSSHRLSVPPQRPPPTSALPPAPDQDAKSPETTPTPPAKSSFHDSVANRTFRFSMIAPKPPPTSVLPPRPDEVSSKSHRRISTGSFPPKSTSFDPIPASPAPALVAPSPRSPPPMDPLPPTPTEPQFTISQSVRPISRHIPFSKRLRIRSAPSPPTALSTQPQHTVMEPQKEDDILSGVPSLRRPSTGVARPTVSPPATPIAEKITSRQDDPSFLQIVTPVVPHLPAPRILPVPPEPPSEIIPLPPPPRRGSKPISVMGSDTEPLAAEEDKLSPGGERKLISLSRPSSVISLAIVSV
ncbi:hypothetical protein C0995_004685 [Termitomyces sp. Mi166|nr:hypothetical protein C0995_004685 [Termitomyces sp. Mi166\